MSALIELSENIIEAIQNREKVVGIFMDLSKGFNSLSHDTLLQKLNLMEITGVSLNWFDSYLLNRTQFVDLTSWVDKREINVIYRNI